MMVVLQLLNLTGLDVVFSDADNVFHHDPFGQATSLGGLIRSGKYDYVYQAELRARPKRSDYKSPGDGGNTGFFYASGRRKPAGIQGLFRAVVAEVDANLRQKGHGADQPIFW